MKIIFSHFSGNLCPHRFLSCRLCCCITKKRNFAKKICFPHSCGKRFFNLVRSFQSPWTYLNFIFSIGFYLSSLLLLIRKEEKFLMKNFPVKAFDRNKKFLGLYVAGEWFLINFKPKKISSHRTISLVLKVFSSRIS